MQVEYSFHVLFVLPKLSKRYFGVSVLYVLYLRSVFYTHMFPMKSMVHMFSFQKLKRLLVCFL